MVWCDGAYAVARQHFAWGALWSAIFILAGTHVLNPDEFIVKTNLALMQQGREFDAGYNSQLSDDTLPAVFRAFPQMSEEDQRTVLWNLARRHCEKLEEHDLRSWNISRSSASSLLVANSGFVDILGGCEAPGLKRYSHDMD